MDAADFDKRVPSLVRSIHVDYIGRREDLDSERHWNVRGGVSRLVARCAWFKRRSGGGHHCSPDWCCSDNPIDVLLRNRVMNATPRVAAHARATQCSIGTVRYCCLALSLPVPSHRNVPDVPKHVFWRSSAFLFVFCARQGWESVQLRGGMLRRTRRLEPIGCVLALLRCSLHTV